MKKLDSVEREYLEGIARAVQDDDSDRALELMIGLEQYRTMFKVEHNAD